MLNDANFVKKSHHALKVGEADVALGLLNVLHLIGPKTLPYPC